MADLSNRMERTVDSSDVEREYCRSCERMTPHTICIELQVENPDAEHAEFSREPYRIATCRDCRDNTSKRMNDQ
jgi:hypothetical protein